MAAIFLVNKIHLEMPAGFEISFFQAHHLVTAMEENSNISSANRHFEGYSF